MSQVHFTCPDSDDDDEECDDEGGPLVHNLDPNPCYQDECYWVAGVPKCTNCDVRITRVRCDTCEKFWSPSESLS